MKKIPTVLVRDPEDRAHVLDEVTPGCEWVLAGEGVPTRKYDGTCVRLDEDERWWARREVKPGGKVPKEFVPVHHDEVTGKSTGWVPAHLSSFWKFMVEAGADRGFYDYEPGTYELCGPRVNRNPEKLDGHRLIAHADAEQFGDPKIAGGRPVASLKLAVRIAGTYGYEGIVWHHPDGRMAKLKMRDLP